jgi:tetratricopeptide (TPR) repeat protein
MPKRYTPADIDALIGRILVDAHGEDESMIAFYEEFRGNVQFPQDALVAGQPLSVHEVDYDGNVLRGLVATSVTENGETHTIGLADVVFPTSSKASRYLAAYRKWLGLPDSAAPAGRPKRPRHHKMSPADIDLGAPVDLVVLSVKERAARCRIPGSERIVTLRCQAWRLIPGTVVTVRPRKQWSYAGHPYLSGDLEKSRVDVAALGLVPLELRHEGLWDPSEEYWGEEGKAIPDWASAIIARGPRPQFEMEQVLPGEDPNEPDQDLITRANDLKDVGVRDEAARILMEALATDLRCLDAHAHLGNLIFEHRPQQAVTHYEVGKAIGELSFGDDFDGVLPWGLVDNRPFFRCLHGYGLCLWRLGKVSDAGKHFERMLWLNPSDDLGVRFLLDEVQKGVSWDESKLR